MCNGAFNREDKFRLLNIMATGFERVALEDGAQLAYELYGSYHLGSATPIVLICGMSTIRSDWDRLSRSLAKRRPGKLRSPLRRCH